MADRVRIEPWEAAPGEPDRVVTLDGRPVGRTLYADQAEFVAGWLRTALGDLDGWATRGRPAGGLALKAVRHDKAAGVPIVGPAALTRSGVIRWTADRGAGG